MATSEAEVVADSRHQRHELPEILGKNPSEDALKSWFSDYGWLYICEIKNNSSNTITYNNPYHDKKGGIAPGATESKRCKGYLPLWSHSSRYEIKYYNQAFNEWKTMTIKDLDGDWLISFEQPGIDEDIREFRPVQLLSEARISLIINDTGYRIYGCDVKADLSRISWQRNIHGSPK
uniref:Uncharacterized protein n=1 Tax=Chenopodium quinoa TaxID=63459 RepID=A0A803L0P2_CHEQI